MRVKTEEEHFINAVARDMVFVAVVAFFAGVLASVLVQAILS